MDDRRKHHHHLRCRHAQSLDMDECAAGYLENSHRLLDRPARSWARVGDAPHSRDIYADGGRCRWRICRRLSRVTDRGSYSSHLAKAWQFARKKGMGCRPWPLFWVKRPRLDPVRSEQGGLMSSSRAETLGAT